MAAALTIVAAGICQGAKITPDGTPMAERHDHWAWQPLRATEPPPLHPSADSDPSHPGQSPSDCAVDAFVVARLRAVGLEPAAPAAAHELLRRLWVDLVGLPPPPAAVARFADDHSDAAYRREVEALLASERFGERWARHWLDLVRYAETLGHEFDYELPNAWRYRDYVIRAFNRDVPYDQFVKEHIAGDLLPEPRRDADGNNESVQATAAWWFVEQTHSPVDHMQHQADRVDNQIDVLGKAFLGMTIACARCHDHKFDAITTRDYYSLFGFVQSSRYVQAPIHELDPDSAPFRQALAAQHHAGEVFAAAAASAQPHGIYATLASSEPADWASDSGIVLRPEDCTIASADDPTSRWFVTNDGFGNAPYSGPFCPDPAADNPELRLLPGPFWLSAVAGTEREGTLATETFALEQRYVHVRVAGVGCRLKLIVDGFHLTRAPIYGGLHKKIEQQDAHWLTFDVAAWQGREAFLQAIDQLAPDLGDPHRNRGQYPKKGWLALQTVVCSPHAAPPTAALPTLTFAWSHRKDALRQLQNAQQALPVSPTVPALADGSGRDSYIYLRGDHHHSAGPAPRRFLSALAGEHPLVTTKQSSGRLELATALLADDNPLPARVLVNRVWHHLFGRGLVKSVDNFGALGETPSHPDLLDWLARDFIANGWSVKHTIRRIVTSTTYRQSSRQRPAAAERDADNVLLHRHNVRALEAEVVRDSLLSISGRLDPLMFGPSIEQPAAAITHARGKPKRHDPRDGRGRRSVYLAVRRNFMSAMLLAFDLPTPFATVGARHVSNVPAQALTLANDPFVHDQCQLLAERLRAHAASAEERLQHAYRLAFARPPRPVEQQECLAFLSAHGGEDIAAWTDLVHALVNTTEFRFRR